MLARILLILTHCMSPLQHLHMLFSLTIRIWIAKIFFLSGLTKIQSWDSTLSLFKYEYKVPILPYNIAAFLGTAAELILPVLLVLGFATRLTSFALFVFNIVAVVAYYHFLKDNVAAMNNHIYWGVMILVPLIYGGGLLSLDHWLGKWAKAQTR